MVSDLKITSLKASFTCQWLKKKKKNGNMYFPEFTSTDLPKTMYNLFSELKKNNDHSQIKIKV